jgi:hypothetical protein
VVLVVREDSVDSELLLPAGLGAGVGCVGATRRGRVAPDWALANIAEKEAAKTSAAAILILVLIMDKSVPQPEAGFQLARSSWKRWESGDCPMPEDCGGFAGAFR